MTTRNTTENTTQRRFYYARSCVYGWTVYDRKTQCPAYIACVKGVVYDVTQLNSEYKAMTACLKCNAAVRRGIIKETDF